MFSSITIFLFRLYQVVFSPLLVSIAGVHGCKYRITCSEYTIRMIQDNGVGKGLQLGFKRFLTCR